MASYISDDGHRGSLSSSDDDFNMTSRGLASQAHRGRDPSRESRRSGNRDRPERPHVRSHDLDSTRSPEHPHRHDRSPTRRSRDEPYSDQSRAGNMRYRYVVHDARPYDPYQRDTPRLDRDGSRITDPRPSRHDPRRRNDADRGVSHRERLFERDRYPHPDGSRPSSTGRMYDGFDPRPGHHVNRHGNPRADSYTADRRPPMRSEMSRTNDRIRDSRLDDRGGSRSRHPSIHRDMEPLHDRFREPRSPVMRTPLRLGTPSPHYQGLRVTEVHPRRETLTYHRREQRSHHLGSSLYGGPIPDPSIFDEADFDCWSDDESDGVGFGRYWRRRYFG